MKSSHCFSRSTNKPLWVYFSRSKAKNSAQHINQRKKDKLIEYQCDRCKHWHLNPLAKHSPSETCIHCKGRDGQNKQGYPTRAIAQKRVDIIFREKGKKLNIYPCSFNKGWHLTKKQISF